MKLYRSIIILQNVLAIFEIMFLVDLKLPLLPFCQHAGRVSSTCIVLSNYVAQKCVSSNLAANDFSASPRFRNATVMPTNSTCQLIVHDYVTKDPTC